MDVQTIASNLAAKPLLLTFILIVVAVLLMDAGLTSSVARVQEERAFENATSKDVPIKIRITSILAGEKQKERLRPYQYQIPDGYVGWIRVDFNVKDAPALPVEGDYYVIKIPVTGHFQTSTEDAYGLVGDVYTYECRGKSRRLVIAQGKAACRIWGNLEGPATLSDKTPYSFRYFFVGPREEHQKYEFSGENLKNLELEQDGYPRVGPKLAVLCN